MDIFLLIFLIIFFAYGIITRDSVGISTLYMGFPIHENKYFIKSKLSSHIINFIYSLIIVYLLYLNLIPRIFILTVPIIYYLTIFIFVKLYEKKLSSKNS